VHVGDYNVYILRCADGSLYTGIAVDVERRVDEHRRGVRGAKYLRGRLPVELVFECPAGDRASAQRLEHRVKRLSRPQKEAVVAGELEVDGLRAMPVQASGAGAG
jgi:putative endonuclease